MRKIKALLDKGWTVDFRKETWVSGGYVYTVWASHDIWGDVDADNKKFSAALDEAYAKAKKLESAGGSHD